MEPEANLLPEFLYRYDTHRFSNQNSIELRKYKVLSETKCGYWIDENYPLRLDAPWIVNFQTNDRKFVLKGNDGKRFAYASKEAAIKGYIARKKRRVKILKSQFETAKDELKFGERLLTQFVENGTETIVFSDPLVFRSSYDDNY